MGWDRGIFHGSNGGLKWGERWLRGEEGHTWDAPGSYHLFAYVIMSILIN